MKHLLVTNDFPPKVGGIQNYLWELWRRLPADDVTVFTSAYEGAEEFDKAQAYRVVRSTKWWLLPTPGLIRQINKLAEEVGAELILIDPALPLGLIGPHLKRPYAIVGHGAELVIPARIPLAAQLNARVMGTSVGLLTSGEYAAAIGRRWSTLRDKPVVSVAPGVDLDRFKPLTSAQKAAARVKFGLPTDVTVVVGMSRLVKRKGFDRLIKASASLKASYPNLTVAIAGRGREANNLESLAAKLDAPVTFLGRVSDDDLPELLGCADIFVMACHDRWFGLEREGFGIVFVEAAACAVPVVAGLSGGSAEAVAHGQTGIVVEGRVTPKGIEAALRRLLDNPDEARRFGQAGRSRMEAEFGFEVLTQKLVDTMDQYLQQSRR